MGYALRGQEFNPYRTGDKDIAVRIRFKEEDRETLRQLRGFYVPAGENGAFVPLSAVADVSFLAAFPAGQPPTQPRLNCPDVRRAPCPAGPEKEVPSAA